jgi:hypothetical protein
MNFRNALFLLEKVVFNGLSAEKFKGGTMPLL